MLKSNRFHRARTLLFFFEDFKVLNQSLSEVILKGHWFQIIKLLVETIFRDIFLQSKYILLPRYQNLIVHFLIHHNVFGLTSQLLISLIARIYLLQHSSHLHLRFWPLRFKLGGSFSSLSVLKHHFKLSMRWASSLRILKKICWKNIILCLRESGLDWLKEVLARVLLLIVVILGFLLVV